MHALSCLLLATVELVADGRARYRVAADDSASARFAADLVRRHAVLLTGIALPEAGQAPALRFRSTDAPGYTIRQEGPDMVVAGRGLVRAAYEILEGWGCDLAASPPVLPRCASLPVAETSWTPPRALWLDAQGFDTSVPATGVAVHGLGNYDRIRCEGLRALGFDLRVASTTFDDFLPPGHFAAHPEWFALRGGERAARGNFALTNPDARAAYLEALGTWLGAHPEVDCLGLWPEVTLVWCEESERFGHAESYALLWREAAERFSARRFEILATGLTLRPPSGAVPGNVDVRIRPGRDASGLQGLAGQALDAIVRAWEARGARVVLEIDAAPASWCGMPWPCHDAVRENARRFPAAVLRGGGPALARIWMRPEEPAALDAGTQALLERARHVASWGHPSDAADLFPGEGDGDAFRIAATERIYRAAADVTRDLEARRSAAADAWLGYLLLAEREPFGRTYERYRGRDFRALVRDLLPEGAEHTVGPARVREGLDAVRIETDRLQLTIGRETAAVVSLRRLRGDAWGDDLGGNWFSVTSPGAGERRSQGRVRLSSPSPGRLRIDLRGHVEGAGAWRTRLDLAGGASVVRQASEVSGAAAVVLFCRWARPPFDRWVCPAYASEGGMEQRPAFRMPPGTLLYCRAGEAGAGLAVRLPAGGTAAVADGLLATERTSALAVDWIVFNETMELGQE